MKIEERYNHFSDLVSKKAEKIADRFLQFLARKFWGSFIGVWLLHLPKMAWSFFRLAIWGIVASAVYYLLKDFPSDLKGHPTASAIVSLFWFVDFSKVNKFAFFMAIFMFGIGLLNFLSELVDWILKLDFPVKIEIEID